MRTIMTAATLVALSTFVTTIACGGEEAAAPAPEAKPVAPPPPPPAPPPAAEPPADPAEGGEAAPAEGEAAPTPMTLNRPDKSLNILFDQNRSPRHRDAAGYLRDL